MRRVPPRLLLSLAAFTSVQISSALPIIVNPGFETDSFVGNGYANSEGNGPITGWTVWGAGGVNPTSVASPFFDNAIACEGTKVAFLQGSSVLQQVVSGFVVGQQYALEFYATSRAATLPSFLTVWLGNLQTQQIIMPTRIVESMEFAGSRTRPMFRKHMIFTATKTSYTLTFQADKNGYDSSVCIDGVTITPVGLEVSSLARLGSAAYSAGATYITFSAQNAFDNDTSTHWNAPASSTWIEVNLGKTQSIIKGSMLLYTAANSSYTIKVYGKSSAMKTNRTGATLIKTISVPARPVTVSQRYSFALDTSANFRYIQCLVTSSNPNDWIGVNDIALYASPTGNTKVPLFGYYWADSVRFGHFLDNVLLTGSCEDVYMNDYSNIVHFDLAAVADPRAQVHALAARGMTMLIGGDNSFHPDYTQAQWQSLLSQYATAIAGYEDKVILLLVDEPGLDVRWTREKQEELVSVAKAYLQSTVRVAVNYHEANVTPQLLARNLDVVAIDPYIDGAWTFSMYENKVNPAIAAVKQNVPGKPILLLGAAMKNGLAAWTTPAQQKWYWDTAVNDSAILGVVWFLLPSVADPAIEGVSASMPSIRLHNELGRMSKVK